MRRRGGNGGSSAELKGGRTHSSFDLTGLAGARGTKSSANWTLLTLAKNSGSVTGQEAEKRGAKLPVVSAR